MLSFPFCFAFLDRPSIANAYQKTCNWFFWGGGGGALLGIDCELALVGPCN